MAPCLDALANSAEPAELLCNCPFVDPFSPSHMVGLEVHAPSLSHPILCSHSRWPCLLIQIRILYFLTARKVFVVHQPLPSCSNVLNSDVIQNVPLHQTAAPEVTYASAGSDAHSQPICPLPLPIETGRAKCLLSFQCRNFALELAQNKYTAYVLDTRPLFIKVEWHCSCHYLNQAG